MTDDVTGVPRVRPAAPDPEIVHDREVESETEVETPSGTEIEHDREVESETTVDLPDPAPAESDAATSDDG